MIQLLRPPASQLRALFVAFVLPFLLLSAAQAAERDKIEAFLKTTGFDVALDSIALSAGSAPEMLGLQESDFGAEWNRLSEQVFKAEIMRGLALDILEQTLEDTVLDHAAAFYASDLGQRLVAAENASHMVEEEELKHEAGNRIIEDLLREDSERVAVIRRMNAAVGSADASVKAIQQIQFRFLMAANTAGIVDLNFDADGLRALLAEQEDEMRSDLQETALVGAAYTYQDFTNAELAAYAEALEHPLMQSVYELLNAVQHEITANRFEALAYQIAKIDFGQDI